jgi:hypothetical protein
MVRRCGACGRAKAVHKSISASVTPTIAPALTRRVNINNRANARKLANACYKDGHREGLVLGPVGRASVSKSPRLARSDRVVHGVNRIAATTYLNTYLFFYYL